MRRAILAGSCFFTLSVTAWAQGAVAGTVKDQSGLPMAGVTIVASSPALIEQTRTTTSDGTGQYRIADLPPGTYALRFIATGFPPHELSSVQVTASTVAVDITFTAARSETVTVVGDVSAIDRYDAAKDVTLEPDVVRSLPIARSYNALLVLVPGIVTNVNDTVTGTSTMSFPMHGGRTNEGRLTLDGLNIGSPPSGNSATSYSVDVGQAQGVTFSTGGGFGEQETSGLVMNIVTESGGNTTHGSIYTSVGAASLQSDNLTPALRSQGVAEATPLARAYDVAGTFGGPIAENRLWYFVNGHLGGSRKDSPNVSYNLNAGDASAWLYAPDPNRREYSDRTFENAGGRMTWQVTPRQTITGLVDTQALCRTCTGATPGLSEPQSSSPEAVGVLGRPLYVSQVRWTASLTSRLVADVSYGGTYFGVGNFERDPNPTRDLIRVVERCAGGCAANGNIPGLAYRSQDFSDAHTGSYLWKGSIAYVTGASAFKAGYQQTRMTDDRTWRTNDQNLTYRFDNGVPNQLTESISPWVNDTRAAWQALFAQEQWTVDRLTLQGAVRFDRAWSWFPRQQEGPSRFLPTPIIMPETRGVDSYADLTVRMGAVFDLNGTGKTVLKASLGKYLEGVGTSGVYANSNPTLRLPRTTTAFGTAGVTRAWTDANGNFVPDCNLLNPAAQDLRAGGGDLCGVVSNTQFGANALTSNFDPALLRGWGVRPSDWHFSVSLERQLGARSSLEVTYVRRSFHGFSVADNLALEPGDLTPFSVTAPMDPRLPDGGGYIVSGLYDVVPDKAGRVDNLVTDAARYGAWTQSFDGVDVSLNARVGRSLTVIGGTSTGQTVSDNCAVRASLPELATTTTGTSAFGAGLAGSAVTPTSPYCHVSYGVLTQFRGLATWLGPHDFLVAAAIQSKPGAMLAANYAVPNSAVAPSLGRPLSANASSVVVNLVAPGSLYGDRVNQLDLRLGKTFRLGGSSTLVALDLFNMLNSSAVLTYDSTFVPGGPWLQPQTILTPRFARITAELRF